MVKYYYDKHTAQSVTTTNATLGGLRATVTDMYTNTFTLRDSLIIYDNIEINSEGRVISTSGSRDIKLSTGAATNLSQYAGKYVMFGVSDEAFQITTSSTAVIVMSGSDYARRLTNIYLLTSAKMEISFLRGTLLASNLQAEDGTYPIDGRHTDGYWYVRKAVANAAPTLTVATTDNRTLYENDQYNVTGQVIDTDVGNVVITKYSINGGTERAITSTISQGTSVPYNKVLTFKQGKLFDGSVAVTDTLTDGSQHVLRVWAEDDKGGKSAEQVRVFYVVANRSAVLTINPVTSKSDLIDSDTIAISGNVSDPDGNTVTVRYKIGNGLYSQVYSGTGGAFNFNVALADLQIGVNTVMVQATDSYGLSTTKTLRVTKSANNKPLLKSVATYKLTPPNGSADGIVLWVQRETGDLIVNAEISMGANGAVENFVPMVKDSTAYVTDAIEEDEFTFDNGAVSAENIVVRLTMERTSATSDKAIKLISGVLS